MIEKLNRRAVIGRGVATATSLLGSRVFAAAPDLPRNVTAAADFDELWSTLADHYCFFADKRVDWARVRAFYRPQAVAAVSIDALQDAAVRHPENYEAMQIGAIERFREIVRRVLNELYDPHTQLSQPPEGTVRTPFHDMLVEKAGDHARVGAIRSGSAAADAGIAIGDRITAIDGRPVLAVAQDHLPRCLIAPDPEAAAYALNVAVSGRRGRPRTMTIRSSNAPARNVVMASRQAVRQAAVTWRRLEDRLGLIVIRHFEDMSVVMAFDAALEALKDTSGLVIDVRDNGGGDTTVAKPIMGRLVTDRKPYALMRRREGAGLSAPWTEHVDPRGPFTYTAPVVVLTGHWSASMAEGFPMGLRGMGRATIVGTRMMGLGAAVVPIRLDRTGVAAQFSAEPVYDVEGRPRWDMRPDVEVATADDILLVGVATLRALRG